MAADEISNVMSLINGCLPAYYATREVTDRQLGTDGVFKSPKPQSLSIYTASLYQVNTN